MTTRTERATDWFFTVSFFGIAVANVCLAYKAFFAEAFIFSFAMIMATLLAMLFGIIYLHEILIRRWAERKEV